LVVALRKRYVLLFDIYRLGIIKNPFKNDDLVYV
jgi:hypothetical protein